MNALTKKEIRLLFPNTLICCALGVANLLFTFNNDGSLQYAWGFMLSFVFCGGVAVMLALNSFGAEISSGTFAHLLAQPISRQKVWDTKIIVLAVSLSVAGIIWGGCGLIRLATLGRNLDFVGMVTVLGLFVLAVFSGALWTVLLLRQVAAAFWFTVLVPAVMLMVVSGLCSDDHFAAGVMACVLGVYSLAGFFFARWLFFRAQDVQWSGGMIVMPELRARPAAGTGSRRNWRPVAALFAKELQLHQAQFLIAAVLLVLHLGVRAARAAGNFNHNSSTEFILETFWLLWLVLPLLIGCTAVAEERKLGTLESQLGLPVKRRTQFAVKLLVALILTLGFGALMPLLLEGARILPDIHYGIHLPPALDQQAVTTSALFFWQCLGMSDAVLPWLTFAGMALLIGGISFYVSSLARNTLQTLAPAVAGIAVAWFLILTATIPWPWQEQPFALKFLWHGPLPYLIALPLMAVTLLALARGNFQSLRPNLKIVGSNLLALFLALAVGVTLTSAIYHRLWEKLAPFEPVRGPARLSLANPPSIIQRWDDVVVRLSDGKIWTSKLQFPPSPNPFAALFSHFKVHLTDAVYLDGTNFVSVQPFAWGYVRGMAGLKRDGSLWIAESLPSGRRGGHWLWPNKPKPFLPSGTETNWSSVAPFRMSLLLVKKDGTLWRLGPDEFDFQHQAWPGLRAFTPCRLGAESNWAAAFQSGYQFRLRKTDGSIWGFAEGDTNGMAQLEVTPNFVVSSLPQAHSDQFTSVAQFHHGSSFKVGVSHDGTLRIWADQHLVPDKKYHFSQQFVWRAVDLQIGTETNWLAVAGDSQNLVTLKADGTLWLWQGRGDFYRRTWRPDNYEKEVLDMVPVRLGTHSDWVAVAGSFDGLITLAADGSLWFWPLASAQAYFDEGNSAVYPLLDVSHKPRLLGNIFAAGN